MLAFEGFGGFKGSCVDGAGARVVEPRAALLSLDLKSAGGGSDGDEEGLLWTPGGSSRTSPTTATAGVTPPLPESTPAAAPADADDDGPLLPRWMLDEIAASTSEGALLAKEVSPGGAAEPSRPASAMSSTHTAVSSSDTNLWAPQAFPATHDPWGGAAATALGPQQHRATALPPPPPLLPGPYEGVVAAAHGYHPAHPHLSYDDPACHAMEEYPLPLHPHPHGDLGLPMCPPPTAVRGYEHQAPPPLMPMGPGPYPHPHLHPEDAREWHRHMAAAGGYYPPPVGVGSLGDVEGGMRAGYAGFAFAPVGGGDYDHHHAGGWAPCDVAATPPPPPLHPLTPMQELIMMEREAREHIAAQVATRRRFMYSAIIDAVDAGVDAVKVYLPDTLWEHEYIALALRFAVLRGEAAVVEHIVTRTAYRNYHSVAIKDLYAPDRLATERGLPVCRGSSFMQVALECLLVEYLDARAGGATAAGGGVQTAVAPAIANREEIVRLLLTAPGMCLSPSDATSLQSALDGSGSGSALLQFWATHTGGLRCTSRLCPNLAVSATYPQRPLPPPLAWSPVGHPHFPAAARRRVRAVCRGMLACGVPQAVALTVLACSTWCGGGKADPAFPVRTSVKDQLGLRVEVLDASPAAMKRFKGMCHKKTVPYAGMKVAVTCRGGGRGPHADGATTTGHLTGCFKGQLCWRPSGALGSEPLGDDVFINPLTIQDNRPPRAQGDCWLCGMCMLVMPDRVGRCKRCSNTHEGALALEGQRRRQGAVMGDRIHAGRGSMSTAGHTDTAGFEGGKRRGSAADMRGGGGRGQQGRRGNRSNDGHRAHANPWRAAAHLLPPLLQPYTMLNLSAEPPRSDVFETADSRLTAYRVVSGEPVRVHGRRGTVLGVGADDALYWVQDGAAGATRLALTPDHFAGVLAPGR